MLGERSGSGSGSWSLSFFIARDPASDCHFSLHILRVKNRYFKRKTKAFFVYLFIQSVTSSTLTQLFKRLFKTLAKKLINSSVTLSIIEVVSNNRFTL
jgi:hypothetical protein